MKQYDLPALANASGKDLIEFIGENQKVIGEVTGHIANLERLKGTSQSHALGYREYLPDEVAIEDMSAHLSKKGYQISLESLSTVLLVAAAAAVVAGIGIIAYKLMRASMSKEPKSVKMLDKQKVVQQMAVQMFNIQFTGCKPDTQSKLKERFLHDTIREISQGYSDADILNKTFNLYVASELVTAGTPYYSAIALRKGDSAVFVYAANAYLAGVKESLEAFRREFLDVIANSPDITDSQMVNLIKDLKWDKLEGSASAGVGGLMSWARLNGVPASNTLEDTLALARDTLGAPINATQAREFNNEAAPVMVAERSYADIWKLLSELKATSKYIEGAKSNFVTGEKRSQQVVDMFREQVARAVQLVDSIGVVEALARLESDSIVKMLKANTNASKSMLNAIQDVIDKLEDKEEAKELQDTLKEIAKLSAKALSMKVENLAEDRMHLGEIMALEGRSPVLDFLKVIGIALLIGLAVHAFGALLMSMMGLASFSAGFKGGLSYMDKYGKQITTTEAAKLVAARAKERELSQFGVDVLSKGTKPPFNLSGTTPLIAFEEMRGGIKNALSSFSSDLRFTNDAERDSELMIKASSRSIVTLNKTSASIIGRLKEMGVGVSLEDPTKEEAVNNLRAAQDTFRDKWFTGGSNVDYGKLERGIESAYWATVNKDTPDKITSYGEQIIKDLQNFGQHFRNVSKEKLASLSDEAREAHRGFMQSMAYCAAVAGVMEVLMKEAVGDHFRAISCVREVLKMRGESMDDIDDGLDDTEQLVDFQDPIDDMWPAVEGASEFNAEDQGDMALESWGQVARTGFMVVGVLALMGIGGILLKRMSESKTPPKASKETFTKVAAGQAACSEVGKMADNMQQSVKALAEDVEQSAKMSKWKEQKAPIREVIGREGAATTGRADTAAEPAAETSQVVVSKDIEAELDKAMATLEELKQEPYIHRLVAELKSTKSSLMVWGFSMMGPNDAFKGSANHIQEILKPALELVREGIIVIRTHANRMALAADPVAYAEQHYDEIVALLEKVSGNSSIEGIQQLTDKLDKQIDESLTVPNAEQEASMVNRYNEKAMSDASGPYEKMHDSIVDLLDEVDEVIKHAESSTGSRLKAKLDSLRGQNNKASSLLLRIDEFRPLFTANSRALRMVWDFGTRLVDGVNRSLAIHRGVQRGVARQMKDITDRVDAATRSAKAVHPDMDLEARWDAAEKKMKGILKTMDDAGL